MKMMVIEGGKKLKGKIPVSGSKNAALPIMAAAILGDGPSVIHNVPDLTDIRTMSKLLKILGATVEFKGHTLTIDPSGINKFTAPYELVKTMRASIYVLGPLVAKYKKAKVSLPGGCAIGARPIDLHIKGIQKLGAKIVLKHGYVSASAAKLKGTKITFDKVSLGATVNILLASSLAEGTTVIENASKEPEVIDCINFLQAMGAKIEGAGTNTLKIHGVKKLSAVKGYNVIPDRIEAATFITAAVITKGRVTVTGLNPEHLSIFIEKLKETGVKITQGKNKVDIFPYKGRLKPVDVVTEPYPGFPTDVQAQWMALMCFSRGDSIIKETIWENRFMHVQELVRMGASVRINGNTSIVTGVKELSGADVMASDLRASAALILAGLAAKGKTVVRRIYHLERGYENIDLKLKNLGAVVRIERENAV
ncbi:MAG: UDP-N-acetylglucosamine 1-carboxyvinyltransferase [Candidatus Goldbacteria bacterium]|nr:UDP-N-acetylglucosamine 1-carboxyvinyltransferase [Candidatus Goldiibacteriota bacterium]